ncbi:MAG: radical SAM protein [Candidatus Cloacimonetes bacterium]|nr:radical SAM protein [Bacteroidota bacterium]MBL7086747.1 radical SAM protein [Candidatus Cloacimonadota bacterium]
MPTQYLNNTEKKSNLIIFLTNECHLDCNYCYLQKPTLKKIVNLNYLKKILKNGFENYDEILIEFTNLHSSIFYLLKQIILDIEYFSKIYEKNYNLSLQTNGVYLKDEIIEYLSYKNFSVGLSLDGPELINDQARKFKNGKGTGKYILDVFNQLLKHNIKHLIRCTISRSNFNKPDELYDFYNKIGVERIVFNRQIDIGMGLVNRNKMLVNVEEYLNFQNDFHLKIIKDKNWLLIDNYIEKWIYRIQNDSRGWIHFCSTNYCHNNNILVILPEKNIYPCTRFVNGQTVKKHELSEYIKNHCTNCIAYSYCSGGCPHGLNFNPNRLSDECKYTQWIFSFISEKLMHHLPSNWRN